jgi:intracellular multiplication protein IcmK
MRESAHSRVVSFARKVSLIAVACSILSAPSVLSETPPAPNAQQLQSMADVLRQNPQLTQQISDILAGKTPPTTQAAPTMPSSPAPSSSNPLPASDSSAASSSNASLPSMQQASPSQPTTTTQQLLNSSTLPGSAGMTFSQTAAGTAAATTGSVLNDTGNLSSKWQEVVNKQAYKGVVQQAFPLTPNQIKDLHNRMDDTQRAAATPAYNQSPTPTSTSLILNLAPGATPPVIRLSLGFVTSLVFVDSTGSPWPIEAYDIGNPTAFDITWNKKNNTLMLQARAAYTYGNMAVKLVKMNTPIMLTLVPGQRVVDYRVDLRVPNRGPHAKPEIVGSGLPDEADERLLDVLDGIPPEGSTRLTVHGADAEAWAVDGVIFLRTRFNVLSPAWLATMASADGMNAYKMAETPLILLARYGKTTQLHVEGY